jgi:hypothetical protein
MQKLRLFKVIVAIVFLLCSVEASVEDKADKAPRDEEQAIIQFVDQWKYYFETVKDKDMYLHRLADQAICNRTQICDTFDGKSYFCSSVCQLGTVQVDPLMQNAFELQRELQADMPLNKLVIPSSHNSAIAKAYGYGLWEDAATQLINKYTHLNTIVYIANQQFTLTDQMNMGIRALELDTHWFDDQVSICHAGGLHLPWLDDFVVLLGKVFNTTLDWDSETVGCFGPDNVPLVQVYQEIRDWLLLPQNSQEFLMFMFDDQADLDTWGKVPLVVQAIDKYFGAWVFTPADKDNKYPDRWPSINELRQDGKKIMFLSTADYGADMNKNIFFKHRLWVEHGAASGFAPYPSCSWSGQYASTNGNMTRITSDSLIWGPFYNGPIFDGILMPDNLQALTACGWNMICADQASPLLIKNDIWTWDIAAGEPRQSCAMVNSKTGKWNTDSCDQSHVVACRLNDDAFAWRVNITLTSSWSAAQTLCANQGLVFDVPSHPLSNQNLLAEMMRNGVQRVWIKWTDQQ